MVVSVRVGKVQDADSDSERVTPVRIGMYAFTRPQSSMGTLPRDRISTYIGRLACTVYSETEAGESETCGYGIVRYGYASDRLGVYPFVFLVELLAPLREGQRCDCTLQVSLQHLSNGMYARSLS